LDKTRFCNVCGESFEAKTSRQKYCSRVCSSRYERLRVFNLKAIKGKHCKQCGKFFELVLENGNSRQHCSPECSRKSAMQSRTKFWHNLPDKKVKYQQYSKAYKEKVGPDGNLKRLYSRYPDLPKACQSCGENRVLDIAHKPGHERNGAWRSLKNCSPEKIWILCPTCHSLLDRMHYKPSELGLI
jgi:hypothetical protein